MVEQTCDKCGVARAQSLHLVGHQTICDDCYYSLSHKEPRKKPSERTISGPDLLKGMYKAASTIKVTGPSTTISPQITIDGRPVEAGEIVLSGTGVLENCRVCGQLFPKGGIHICSGSSEITSGLSVSSKMCRGCGKELGPFDIHICPERHKAGGLAVGTEICDKCHKEVEVNKLHLCGAAASSLGTMTLGGPVTLSIQCTECGDTLEEGSTHHCPTNPITASPVKVPVVSGPASRLKITCAGCGEEREALPGGTPHICKKPLVPVPEILKLGTSFSCLLCHKPLTSGEECSCKKPLKGVIGAVFMCIHCNRTLKDGEACTCKKPLKGSTAVAGTVAYWICPFCKERLEDGRQCNCQDEKSIGEMIKERGEWLKSLPSSPVYICTVPESLSQKATELMHKNLCKVLKRAKIEAEILMLSEGMTITPFPHLRVIDEMALQMDLMKAELRRVKGMLLSNSEAPLWEEHKTDPYHPDICFYGEAEGLPRPEPKESRPREHSLEEAAQQKKKQSEW